MNVRECVLYNNNNNNFKTKRKNLGDKVVRTLFYDHDDDV